MKKQYTIPQINSMNNTEQVFPLVAPSTVGPPALVGGPVACPFMAPLLKKIIGDDKPRQDYNLLPIQN